MTDFLNGAVTMAAAVVALHYLKAWKQSRDEIFKLFAAAFTLLTLERIVSQLVHGATDKLPLIYCLRLLAFSAIAGGVLQKNLKKAEVRAAE